MFKKIMPIIQHHHTTKLWALILGYSVWYCVAKHQTVTQTYQAPIVFFDSKTNNISAQESITIKLEGSRKDIYFFNPAHAAIHIDGSQLRTGTQEILIDKQNLFLPETIKLIDLIPSHITINVN